MTSHPFINRINIWIKDVRRLWKPTSPSELAFCGLVILSSIFSLLLMAWAPFASKSAINSYTQKDDESVYSINFADTWVGRNVAILWPAMYGLLFFLFGVVHKLFLLRDNFKKFNLSLQRRIVCSSAKVVWYFLYLGVSLLAFVRVYVIGRGGLQDDYFLNLINISMIGVIAMFLFEITYRTSVMPMLLVHHFAVIITATLIAYGRIPAMRNTSYLLWSTLQWIFCLLELVENIALVVYRMEKDTERVRRILAWTMVKLTVSSFSVVGMTIVFYIVHFQGLLIIHRVLLPFVALCFLPAQLYSPHVVLILIEKMHKRASDDADIEANPEGLCDRKPSDATSSTISTSSKGTQEIDEIDLEANQEKFCDGKPSDATLITGSTSSEGKIQKV